MDTPRLAIGSLFAGIGGLEAGLSAATGLEVAWQVEIDPWCRKILAKHWPQAIRWGDVKKCGENLQRVEVICAGFPCQDISLAGKGAGLVGERSGLWYEVARIVGLLRPRFVVLENVSAILAPGRGCGDVLGTLAALGYDAIWTCVRASDLGAPHARDRWFCVAWDPSALGDSHDLWPVESGERQGRGWPCNTGEALADADTGGRPGGGRGSRPSGRVGPTSGRRRSGQRPARVLRTTRRTWDRSWGARPA